MATNEAEVYFGLMGDSCDPDLITAFIGIQPTSTKKKGNPIPKTISFLNKVGASIDVDTYKR